MSIILDALRRVRGKQQRGPNPNAAQTDAVLQTLGYGRLNPATPLNRLKRMLMYLALAVVFGFMLWAVVIWLTNAYVSSVSSAASPAPRTPTAF